MNLKELVNGICYTLGSVGIELIDEPLAHHVKSIRPLHFAYLCIIVKFLKQNGLPCLLANQSRKCTQPPTG